MTVSKALRDDLLTSIPNLRAFAVSLAGNSERADDLARLRTVHRTIAASYPRWPFNGSYLPKEAP